MSKFYQKDILAQIYFIECELVQTTIQIQDNIQVESLSDSFEIPISLHANE